MDSTDDLDISIVVAALHSTARKIPHGLSGRVFQESAMHLPNQIIVGRVGSVTSIRWRAAAAILIMVGGAILAWQTSASHSNQINDDRMLAAVLEASANSSGDENFIGLASAQGAGFDDLASEMRNVLGSKRSTR